MTKYIVAFKASRKSAQDKAATRQPQYVTFARVGTHFPAAYFSCGSVTAECRRGHEWPPAEPHLGSQFSLSPYFVFYSAQPLSCASSSQIAFRGLEIFNSFSLFRTP
jgi:hypothetical protein